MSIAIVEKPRTSCLEDALAQVVRAVLSLGLPSLACVLVTLGAQLAWGMELSGRRWWLAPVGLIAAAAWAAFARPRALARCPVEGVLEHLKYVLAEVLALRWPGNPRVAWTGGLFLVACALPWWPASILWTGIVLVVWLYPRFGSRMLWGLEWALGLGGVALVAGRWTGDPAAWLAWACASISVTAAVFALAAAKKWSDTFIRLCWVAPAATPLAMGPSGSWWLDAMVAAGMLVLWPLMLLGLALFRHQCAKRACMDLLERDERGEPLAAVGRDPDGPREEPVRESHDRYSRACMPIFRHAWPRLSGETGYLARVGGLDDPVLSEESVVFRPTSLADDPLATTADPRARVMADLARGLIPDLGISGLEPVRDAFFDAWSVLRVGPGTRYFAKMPWDDPTLLVVPVRWSQVLRYPAGCGIHDFDGYPCVVRGIAVQVTLGQALLDAVGRVSQAASTRAEPVADDVQIVRLLAWNAWRIVPGVYESLLTCLVRLFRKRTLALFVEYEATARDGREDALRALKAEFLAELNECWPAELPEPLRELVNVQVLRLEIDTHYAGEARSRLFELRQMQVNRLFHRQRDMNETRDRIAELMMTGSFPSPRGQGDPSRLGATDRVHIANNINHAKDLILRSIDEAVVLIGSLPSNPDRSIDPSPVQAALATATEEFAGEVETRFAKLQGTLKDLEHQVGALSDGQH